MNNLDNRASELLLTDVEDLDNLADHVGDLLNNFEAFDKKLFGK